MINFEKNPLKGYRFSINDFTSSQLDELQRMTEGVAFNQILNDKLYYEIRDQLGERRGYYYRSSKKTEMVNIVQWFDKQFKKINFQPQWVQNFLNSSVDSLNKHDPASFQHYDTLESEVKFGSRVVEDKVALAGMKPGAELLSGWDRLKQSFLPQYYAPGFDKHEPVFTFNLNCCFNKPIYAGLFSGVLLAIHHAKGFLKDFDKQNLSNFHESKYDAIRTRHNSFLRGIVRYTFRWGWRVTFLVGSFCFVSQALCIYKLEDKVTHYMAAGFVPGLFWNWKKGPKAMLITGSLFALALGVPIGFIITQTSNPRVVYFQDKVAPKILSPVHYFNWTTDMKKLNEERFNAITELLNLERSGTNLAKIDIMNDLFKPKSSTID